MSVCANLFVNYLKEKEFHYNVVTLESGTVVVDFPYDGKIVRSFFEEKNEATVAMYLVYEKVPEEKYMDAVLLCNQINMEYKWITAFVNKNNEFIFHDDAILSPDNAGEETFSLLTKMISISNGLKPSIMKMIYA